MFIAVPFMKQVRPYSVSPNTPMRLRTRADQRLTAAGSVWFQSEPQSLQQELSALLRDGNMGEFQAHFRMLRTAVPCLSRCYSKVAQALLDAALAQARGSRSKRMIERRKPNEGRLLGCGSRDGRGLRPRRGERTGARGQGRARGAVRSER